MSYRLKNFRVFQLNIKVLCILTDNLCIVAMITGGMGAYGPFNVSEELKGMIEDNIIKKTISQLKKRNLEYIGKGLHGGPGRVVAIRNTVPGFRFILIKCK